ncbi:hypothetical protein TrRE_jg13099, partial [Triparma retinervis]
MKPPAKTLEITPYGFKNDRVFMVARETRGGELRFFTQRQSPGLATISCTQTSSTPTTTTYSLTSSLL